MASENEKTVFGVPGLPLEATEAPPAEKPVAPGEKTMVGLSFADDEMAQLEAAIESVEQRATGGQDAVSRPSTPRAAPLPPPRPRGATAPAPAVATPPAAVSEPPANGTMLMTAADFGDLEAMLSGASSGESASDAASQPDAGATRLFDADEVGDAISGVFDQVTSGLKADAVQKRLDAPPPADEVDEAFAATEVISSDARVAALAALEEQQKEAASKADVRPVAPAPKVESPPPATAAGTLLMSAEMIEQAAAAAVAAAKPVAPPPRPAPPKPVEPAPAAGNATVFLAPEAGVPDSSSTRRALAAADISEAKTEIPAPEKTKRYQTGAVPRVDVRQPQRDSVRREAPLRQQPRSEAAPMEPARRDGAALWIAGIVTVLVLGALAWFLLR